MTKFSNHQIIQTASTNVTVADMLCRDFSQITKRCVNYSTKHSLHTSNLWNSNTTKKSLKQIHYLGKLEDVLSTQI